MSRYPFTILFLLVILVVMLLALHTIKKTKECSDDGGTYAQTTSGWKCIR